MANYEMKVDSIPPVVLTPLMREFQNYIGKEEWAKLLNPMVTALPSTMTATEVKMRQDAADAMQYMVGATKIRKDPMTGKPSAEDMISMRLRFNGMDENSFQTRTPWKHMSAFYDNGVAVVMVVTNNGKPVMIEDEAGLFPSDTLITTLRLLIETGNIK